MRPRSDRPRDAPDVVVEALKYRVGDVIAEKYRLEELTGQGAMGAVWRARNLALDVDVAVKVIHRELVSAETIERLEREAHAAARLEHPSAVRVFDLGQSELGDPFIVMELLRGESLTDLLERRKRLPPDEAVALLLPVANALAAAHAKGIVHRDLKPDNIVVVQQEEALIPKIVDFGIAIVDSPRFRRRSTAAGDVIGSPDYMSPEQARGDENVDARTDVWSLGVVLYECVAGTTPFDPRLTPLALIRAIIETEPPTLLALGAADEELSRIVEHALTKDIGKRLGDVRSFGRALAEWASGRGVEADSTGASIKAAWMRNQRGSLASAGNLRGSSPSISSGTPAAQRVSTSVAVWTPVRRTTGRRNRFLVAGAAVAVVGGLAVLAVTVGRRELATPSSAAQVVAAQATASSAPMPETATAQPATSGKSPELTPTPAGSDSSSRSPSAAAAKSTPVEPAACVVALFPEDAFEPGAPLATVCSQTNPKAGATFVRGEIARHGLIHRKTTDTMRGWATLSWFELAAFGAIQAACCDPGSLAPLHLPPRVGTCPPLDPILADLTKAIASRGDAAAAIENFRGAFACFERARRHNPTLSSSYGYDEAPTAGADGFLRALLERCQKSRR